MKFQPFFVLLSIATSVEAYTKFATTPFLVQSKTNAMSSDVVKAKVQYLASADEGNTATYYASEAGVDEAKEHEGLFKYEEVQVQNGRSKKDWSVNREGFELVENKSAMKDFKDDEEVENVLYKEVQDILLKKVPGAKRVEIFDHTRRASTSGLRKENKSREPSAVVHNDYTAKSANKRLFDMLPEEAEQLSQKRFAIVNLWRSIAGTVQTDPMAFCDSTSIAVDKDLISVKRVSKDRIGQLQMALPNPNHKWYYFPQLTNEEALIFKTFDSEDSVNQFTLHTALAGVGDDSVPRQSIEIRAFVFFD